MACYAQNMLSWLLYIISMAQNYMWSDGGKYIANKGKLMCMVLPKIPHISIVKIRYATSGNEEFIHT